ncbi:MAG TPA: phosphatidylserine decarboxylase [Casimicrobiaceae bacterium]|nr:phosphatidylserine decarboxylase [Casimicrobiaceae bacterium]
MEGPIAALAALAVAASLVAGAYVFWRTVWFWRNPPRRPPPGEGLLAPADGTVVYAIRLTEAEPVVNLKRGLAARLSDIAREDMALPKLLIGVFMSPFDVHFNRAPLAGIIEFVRHHPGRGPNLDMGRMHRRILGRREPYYEGSGHIVQNERAVTKINGSIKGVTVSCYVVQIAARTVSGIDNYFEAGDAVERGAVFGMIRIGSQVDVIIPWRKDWNVRVRPGDRVRAGETVMVD